jgi:competence protein ComEC
VLSSCAPIDPGTCFERGTHFSLVTARELPSGARITVAAKVSERPVFRNPSPALAWPDARLPVQARAIPGASVRFDEASWLARILTSARAWVRARFLESLSAPHAGIARALLLGEGNAVSSELNDAIRNAGVSHVLAVSGMHVTVLAGALVALVRFAWLRSPLALWVEASRAASALGVALAPLVARFCGGAPSAWRAALASFLMYGLKALGLRPDALAVSGFAVLIYGLAEPRETLHPGFVLSVWPPARS